MLMKRLLLLSTISFLAAAAPMQTASADERICQSSKRGVTTRQCDSHLIKTIDNGMDAVACLKLLRSEYKGWTGNGAGKWSNYLRVQRDCKIKLQKALDSLTDAYVPGGDTSPRRLLRTSLKHMDEKILETEKSISEGAE